MTEYTNESLSIELDDNGVIHLGGDIDMAGGPQLEAVIRTREDDNPLAIDVSAVSFIDSSGLRTLLDASRRARARGTDVVLRSVGPAVLRLLEITDTTGQFIIDGHRD